MDKVIEHSKEWLASLEAVARDPGRFETVPVLVIAGIVLLLFGCRIYWLLLLAAGIVAGGLIGMRIMPDEPQWLFFATPGVLALLIGILTWFLHRPAVLVAGMGVGAFMGYVLAGIWLPGWWPVAGLVLGCVLGICLGIWLFDWALILLSSSAGAFLFVVKLPLDPWLRITLGLLLLLCGLAVQSHLNRRTDPAASPES